MGKTEGLSKIARELNLTCVVHASNEICQGANHAVLFIVPLF